MYFRKCYMQHSSCSSCNSVTRPSLTDVIHLVICSWVQFVVNCHCHSTQNGHKKESDDLHIATYYCNPRCNSILLSMSGYSSCLLNGMQVLHSVLYGRHGLDALLLQILARIKAVQLDPRFLLLGHDICQSVNCCLWN